MKYFKLITVDYIFFIFLRSILKIRFKVTYIIIIHYILKTCNSRCKIDNFRGALDVL